MRERWASLRDEAWDLLWRFLGLGGGLVFLIVLGLAIYAANIALDRAFPDRVVRREEARQHPTSQNETDQLEEAYLSGLHPDRK